MNVPRASWRTTRGKCRQAEGSDATPSSRCTAHRFPRSGSKNTHAPLGWTPSTAAAPSGSGPPSREEPSASLPAEVHADLLVRRSLDRDRPARRAAGARVLAEVVGVQAQAEGRPGSRFVFHFENSDYRKRSCPQGPNRRKRLKTQELARPPYCCPSEPFMSDRDTFGPRLRAERERRGISIETIASVTKVGGDLWDGLERNDFSRWPSGIFARAFVRDYARAIGLDADEAVDEFCRLFPLGDRRASRLIQAQAQLIGHHLACAESGALPVAGDRRAPTAAAARRNARRCARGSSHALSPRRSTPLASLSVAAGVSASWTSASGPLPASSRSCTTPA